MQDVRKLNLAADGKRLFLYNFLSLRALLNIKLYIFVLLIMAKIQMSKKEYVMSEAALCIFCVYEFDEVSSFLSGPSNLRGCVKSLFLKS